LERKKPVAWVFRISDRKTGFKKDYRITKKESLSKVRKKFTRSDYNSLLGYFEKRQDEVNYMLYPINDKGTVNIQWKNERIKSSKYLKMPDSQLQKHLSNKYARKAYNRILAGKMNGKSAYFNYWDHQ
jgi:glucose-6-phosphate 1-dehydrogenase